MSNLRLSYLQKVWGGIFVQAIPPPKKVGGYIPPSPRDLRHYREGLLKRGVLYFVKTLKY